MHDRPEHFTESAAMQADWLIRSLAPAALAAAGLPDDACDLELLPEFTPAMFEWPGLLDRCSRILTLAAGSLSEVFLVEHRANPADLRVPSIDVLQEGIGTEAADMADAARIAVLPHLVGNEAYAVVNQTAQLLHFRGGSASPAMILLRDMAVTSLLELQDQLDQATAEAARSRLRPQRRTS